MLVYVLYGSSLSSYRYSTRCYLVTFYIRKAYQLDIISCWVYLTLFVLKVRMWIIMIVDPLNVVTWTRLTSLISMHTMGHNRMYDMAYKMLIFIVCWQCYPRCDKIDKHKRTIECQWCGTTSRHVLCYFSLAQKQDTGWNTAVPESITWHWRLF